VGNIGWVLSRGKAGIDLRRVSNRRSGTRSQGRRFSEGKVRAKRAPLSSWHAEATLHTSKVSAGRRIGRRSRARSSRLQNGAFALGPGFRRGDAIGPRSRADREARYVHERNGGASYARAHVHGRGRRYFLTSRTRRLGAHAHAHRHVRAEPMVRLVRPTRAAFPERRVRSPGAAAPCRRTSRRTRGCPGSRPSSRPCRPTRPLRDPRRAG